MWALSVDTIVSEAPKGAGYDTRRDARYDARYVLWRESTLRRVRACGRFPHDHETGVAIRVREDGNSRRAAFGGVQTCGSVWACPVCSEKIQAERQQELQTAIASAHARGWVVAFATFTVRHHRGAGRSLAKVWDACTRAWRGATSGAGPAWKADREDAGLAGYVRLFETTEGRANGWHVHVHALLFLDPARAGRALYFRDAEALGEGMFERWRKTLRGTSYEPSRRRGFDIRPVAKGEDLAGYFTKGVYAKDGKQASYEVTSTATKTAKHGNRTPFALLADLVRDGDENDLLLWQEWERVSKGKRQLFWSRGLRDALEVAAERTDDEIAEDATLDGEVREWIPGSEYRRLAERRLLTDCLRAAEADSTGEALCAFLNGVGVWIGWNPPDPP